MGKQVWPPCALRTEGVKGMFAGMSINYIRVVPSITISYLVAEFIKESSVFDRLHGEKAIDDERSKTYTKDSK